MLNKLIRLAITQLNFNKIKIKLTTLLFMFNNNGLYGMVHEHIKEMVCINAVLVQLLKSFRVISNKVEENAFIDF